MRKNIQLFKTVTLILILFLTNSNAELTNKIVISVGNEIITDYDIDREIKYLSVITIGQFKNLDTAESRKIAIDSLIKDKVKTNELANHDYIIINDELINNQINRTIRDIGFNNIEDFKKYLELENYTINEFVEKIILELKWNQLVFQFYKNQIVIDKKKIDNNLKSLIAKQKKWEQYLVNEIFIEDSVLKKINKENKEVLVKENIVEEQDGIIIKAEVISYDNKKNIENAKKSLEESTVSKTKDQITMEDVLENIKEQGFENAAIKFSSSPSSQQGGKLGWIDESEFSEILLKFIRNVNLGEITKPIPVTGGFIILKVEDKRLKEDKIDFESKMKELIEIEKNKQLTQFSLNYFNQVKNNIQINYFDD